MDKFKRKNIIKEMSDFDSSVLSESEVPFLSETNQQMLYNIIMREIKGTELPYPDLDLNYLQKTMLETTENYETIDVMELNELTVNKIMEKLELPVHQEEPVGPLVDEKLQLDSMSLYMKSSAAPVEYSLDPLPMNPITNPAISNSLNKNETGFSIYSGNRDPFKEHLFSFQIRFGTDPDTIGINFAQHMNNVVSIIPERMVTPKWKVFHKLTGVIEIIISSDNLVTNFSTSTQSKDVLSVLYPDGYIVRSHRNLIKYSRGATANTFLQAPINLQLLNFSLNTPEYTFTDITKESPDIISGNVTFDGYDAYFDIPDEYKSDFIEGDMIKFLVPCNYKNDECENEIFDKPFELNFSTDSSTGMDMGHVVIDSNLKLPTSKEGEVLEKMDLLIFNVSMQYYIFFKIVKLENGLLWQQPNFRLAV
tara:strand:+ start:177 stop:1442 length:1266 start_codon:yes stop_codon:yes gene_type:complete